MKKIKITAAYCVELEKIVSIEEAHSASMEKNGAEFQFLCSSEECRQQKIPVTGVNYYKPLSKQFRAMHFRDNTHYTHHENCEWVLASEYAFYEGTHEGESPEEAESRRKLFASLRDDYLITVYDPYEPDTGVRTDNSTESTVQKPQSSGTKSNNDRYIEAIKKVRRTSSFYKMARCHYELSRKFKLDKFKQFPLRVKGKQTTWYGYFKIFKYVWDNPTFNGIMYGYISKNIRPYGTKEPFGYGIYMGTKLNDLSVSIYVSPNQMKNYRLRRELIDVLENKENFEDICAYFVPESIELVTLPSGIQSYQIKISNLHNLRFVGTIKKTHETE